MEEADWKTAQATVNGTFRCSRELERTLIVM
jgi:hypothetical protein